MSKQKYAINTAALFQPLQRIDLAPIIAGTTDPWFNQTLCQVNDAVVRLGVLKGEFHWHKHDTQDEFFYVVEGKLIIELEGQSVELGPMQGFAVPMGVQHRPLAPEKTIVLMIERADVNATGD
ncbi:MAG TPA: cupin domain-containing protein [Candidatus Dormibacteraeota bacterium]|jgi:mannose-6-phosphate isomerase-like protein (cupin superfamily)